MELVTSLAWMFMIWNTLAIFQVIQTEEHAEDWYSLSQTGCRFEREQELLLLSLCSYHSHPRKQKIIEAHRNRINFDVLENWYGFGGIRIEDDIRVTRSTGKPNSGHSKRNH